MTPQSELLSRPAERNVLMQQFNRGNSYKLIKKLPESVWGNTVQHSDSGTMTMDDWLDMYDRHVPEHVAQMERIYEEWKQTKKRK